MAPVRVEADTEEESLKAESQSSSSKLDLPLRETPQSVSVSTQASLRARQVVDFGQALEMSAGVNSGGKWQRYAARLTELSAAFACP